MQADNDLNQPVDDSLDNPSSEDVQATPNETGEEWIAESSTPPTDKNSTTDEEQTSDDTPLQEIADIPSPEPSIPEQTPSADEIRAPSPLSPTDERTWATIAHISILLNLFTAILGPIVPLIIYLVNKERSRYVAYQSLQALVFQLVTWIAVGVIAALTWIAAILLSVVIVGLCLMPFALLLSIVPLAALVYGVIGAIETSQGKDFKYWLIGDWVRNR